MDRRNRFLITIFSFWILAGCTYTLSEIREAEENYNIHYNAVQKRYEAFVKNSAELGKKWTAFQYALNNE